jgi:hypothetical protein
MLLKQNSRAPDLNSSYSLFLSRFSRFLIHVHNGVTKKSIPSPPFTYTHAQWGWMPKEEREKLRINIHAARCVNNMQRRLSRNVAAHQPEPRHLNNTSIATLAVYYLIHTTYACFPWLRTYICVCMTVWLYAWMRTGNGLKCFLRAVK